ncbi:uncharacterized protein LOC114004548 [Tupaia chinensis]|uniref:uncharacterized protein LOC114004548 n=1 Tax=Tupaia chinensis TaxID=246437 RepID=UPI000FFC1474|nr:uncharacterized protein LOC114004548 [Tupaia chinensis]
MRSDFGSLLAVVLLLILRRTHGDSVTQTEGPVTLSEEAALTLNCTYQTSNVVFLFWYVQYVNKAPQLLLKRSLGEDRAENEGFYANHIKDDSSFHLQKRSVQTSDSAVYYCAMRDTVGGTAGGAEHKPERAGGAWVRQPWEGELWLLSRTEIKVALVNQRLQQLQWRPYDFSRTMRIYRETEPRELADGAQKHTSNDQYNSCDCRMDLLTQEIFEYPPNSMTLPQNESFHMLKKCCFMNNLVVQCTYTNLDGIVVTHLGRVV